MEIPSFQSVMLPLIKVLRDGRERTIGLSREPLIARHHRLASSHGFGKVEQRW
jgi:hypothetical protein